MNIIEKLGLYLMIGMFGCPDFSKIEIEDNIKGPLNT